MFTWTPIYTELATAIQPFKTRQRELIAILEDIRKTGIPIIRLIDAPNPATGPILTSIDPFTFFACFNRGLTNQNRMGILKILKERLSLKSDVPEDFSGIPVVDNQLSWFFPYPERRKSDDIESLWKLAEAIIGKPPEELDPVLFDRCLEIHTVGPAKLTMGMFWMNPQSYLALDDKNRTYFASVGINDVVTSCNSYQVLLQQVRQKLGKNYIEISSSAWERGVKKTQFWAGGFLWDEESKLEEFINGNFWEIGWDRNETNAAAQKCWRLFDKINVDDFFAIKGHGGRNDLNIHYVGKIIKKENDGKLRFQKIDQSLYHGKAPTGSEAGNWFDALVPITRPDVIKLLFTHTFNHPLADKKTALVQKFDQSQSSRNIILFGPPGTGKTYRLRNEYMEKFTDRQTVLSPEEQATTVVKDLAWWEVIALALLDIKDNRASVAQILDHTLVRARLKLSTNKNPRAMLWASLQSHTKKDCSNVNYTTRIEPLLFSKDEESIWSIDSRLTKTETPELYQSLQLFRNPTREMPVVTRYKFTTFHQSFSYEDFIEGIKPQVNDGTGNMPDGGIAYEIQDGIFKEICREAAANPKKRYAFFIDEINRGNVASIFGELITLIEDDKRLGSENELIATLPYSRQKFGVPSNLCIIGTMNTADRSVEALDTALRRRFTFIEMRPDGSVINQPPALMVNLRTLFDVINARIERLLDHDHCIGHAYFLNVQSLSDLQHAFATKIIPLMKEYFYGNPAKIGLVLGGCFISRKPDTTPFATGDWGLEDLDDKAVYQFTDVSTLSESDFASIYA